jgi:superfamily II DNA or RNA helicase
MCKMPTEREELGDGPGQVGTGSSTGGTVALDALLRALDRRSASVFGRQGEDVARLALWRSPETRDGLVAVRRWADWVTAWNVEHPGCPERATDRGIDLVATYADGHHTAVQVKLREGGGLPISVGWEELATFVAKSATAPFSDRLLILLGDATLSSNARDELARQAELTIWAAADIDAHAGDWWPPDHAGVLGALRDGPAQALAPRPLRSYQLDAVADVEKAFSDGSDRAQLLMACGTGKTITTQGVAAALAADRLLVLAPSLSLLRQLINDYRWQYGGRMDGIAVCSDTSVGAVAPGEDVDDPVVTDAELGVPTVANPVDIGAFLAPVAGERPRVVFATYQSSRRVADAQADEGVPAFDLAVADEAHYLAGRPSAAFATVLEGTAIRATRRLFATATPRLVAPHVRASDPEVWASMDDPALFGPVAHRLPFGEAIQADLLSDYRLLVLGADEHLAAAIDTRVLVDAGIVTDARTLATALAVLRLARDHGRRRILTFHSRKSGARTFARLLQTHRAWVPAELRMDLVAETVTGEQPSDVRAAALARLARAGAPGQPAVRVLTNARCLTAGVDVPALDAVVFVDPRRSRVDVVQAVGRVLRRAEGKELGHVVVPVPVEDPERAEAAVTGSGFAEVWEVLAALADHDDVLAEQIERARRELGRTGRVGEVGRQRLVVDVPGVDADQLAAGVWLQAVTRIGSSWSQGLGALEEFNGTRGHARVPQGHVTAQGFALGRWVVNQRQARKANRMPQERIEALDALGFVWDPHGGNFARGLAALTAFVGEHHHAEVPSDYVTSDGFRLGGWVNARRQDRKKDRLADERITALDALGFVWDVLAETFARGMAALEEFKRAHRHTRVPEDHLADSGFPLGLWVGHMRQMRRQGRLAIERIEALDQLDFTWDVRADGYSRGLAALEAFVAGHGHARVSKDHLTDDGFPLGQWVYNRRRERNLGQLSDDRTVQLDALGFSWDPAGEDFTGGLATLAAFVAENGHARVPKDHVTAEGFDLGKWVLERRSARGRGRLTDEQICALDALGFIWVLRDDNFARGVTALEAFIDEHGHTDVPDKYVTGEGFRLGNWVRLRRQDRKAGRLSADRIAALDTLGFVWDRQDEFPRGLGAMQAFVAANGHGRVPRSHVTDDGFALGRWADSRRRDRDLGRLPAQRIADLDALGFVWAPHEDDFARGLAYLRMFVAEHHHARVPQSHVTADGYRLGAWMNKRRQARKRGRLTDAQIRDLDGLGFEWEPHSHAFVRGAAALEEFIAITGHARVPSDHVTDEGFRLGSWVANRRHERKLGQLSDDRVAVLDDLGFLWSAN